LLSSNAAALPIVASSAAASIVVPIALRKAMVSSP
jgi:hypothetical protein